MLYFLYVHFCLPKKRTKKGSLSLGHASVTALRCSAAWNGKNRKQVVSFTNFRRRL